MKNSYWNNTGELQTEYQRLYDELVPTSGEAKTEEGELLRAISNLYHDYNNNGNGNALECEWTTEYDTCSECCGSGEQDEEDEPCDECGGSGETEEEVEGEAQIQDRWLSYIDLISEKVNISEDCEKLKKYMIENYGSYNFQSEESKIYDRIVTKVIQYVLDRKEYTKK